MCVGIEEELTKCFIFTKDDDKPPDSSFVFFSSITEENDKLKRSLLSCGFFLGCIKLSQP
jgi:hypothetical protein